MESTEETPKKEHHLAKKARLAREAKEAELNASGGNPSESIPKKTNFVTKKPKRFIRAFEKEYYHYVATRRARGNTMKDKRQQNYNQRFWVPGIDTIIHPETGKPCVIRHIEGQKSIFKDEQTHDVSNSDCKPILFEEGGCSVHHSRTTTIEFLNLCNCNVKAKNRRAPKHDYLDFILWAPEDNAKEVYDKEMGIAEAMVYVSNKCKSEEGVEDLMAYAQTLMIDMGRSWIEIKADLMLFLKKDPKSFLEGLDSKNMKRKYIIMEALRLRVLVQDSSSGTISWASGGALCTPPIGKDPIEYCVDWSFDKGNNSFDHIREQTEKLLLEQV